MIILEHGRDGRRALVRAVVACVLALCGAARLDAQQSASVPSVRAESLDAPSLARRVGYQVVLPAQYDSSRVYPVLWLLHGYSGNGSNWLQRTRLLQYVERDPFIVILPSADDSWYANAGPGARYDDLVTRDIYADVRRRFSIDTTRQAIAGLSMGGYGALTLALRHPGRFRFAGGLSAALFTRDDLEHPVAPFASLIPSLRTALGDPSGTRRAEYDPFALVMQVPLAELPYVYLAVGTNDGYRTFLSRNRALADSLRARTAPYEYHERPGAHAWTFWDPELGALMDRAWEIVSGGSRATRATIVVDTSAVAATFDPLVALGSTIDGHMRGSTARIFTRANVAAMTSANFHPISYRLRTELAIEAWHWNPRGRWSDAEHAQGYWTSDTTSRAPITTSFGYRLPRRGSTIDQANEDGYSRVVDGDTSTFWKSNPYLDTHFTQEPNDRHPQWLLIELEDADSVDAIRLRWGVPFATRYEVQYWAGRPPVDPDDNTEGDWRTFPHGAVGDGHGGTVTLRLSDAPIPTHWIRVLMHESSHSAPRGSRDVRDSLGYAVRELALGTLSSTGALRDLIRHTRSATTQTRVVASSTDPWHRATDVDRDVEQPGVDLLFSSGITRGLPMLLPVGVLYDTPDNAAALLRYVRMRGYSIPRVELGEEPDGQYASPDDFAALYLQTAQRLREVDASIQLGGPSFQSNEIDAMMAWRRDADARSWLARFVAALQAHGRSNDFRFLSFEWYPFDSLCINTERQLARAVPRLRESMAMFRSAGLPPDFPILITEYGYSAFAGAPEVSRAGAILNTESVAEFLTLGGQQAFLYGTEPSSLDRNAECESWGDNTLFIADGNRAGGVPTATYHAARLLTTAWTDSAGGPHTLYRARIEHAGAAPPLGAYPVRWPNGRRALLLINRDSLHTWTVAIASPGRATAAMRGVLDEWQLSRNEYEWHARGAQGFAHPNRAPRHDTVQAGAAIELPPYSITVLRER